MKILNFYVLVSIKALNLSPTLEKAGILGPPSPYLRCAQPTLWGVGHPRTALLSF